MRSPFSPAPTLPAGASASKGKKATAAAASTGKKAAAAGTDDDEEEEEETTVEGVAPAPRTSQFTAAVRSIDPAIGQQEVARIKSMPTVELDDEEEEEGAVPRASKLKLAAGKARGRSAEGESS